MIYKSLIYSFLLLAVAILGACTDDLDPGLEQAVIEGWIDSDGYPTVMFTTTLNPDEKGGSIIDNMIRWGVIKISDGTQEVILTGSADKNILPPYRYHTTKMRGVPGRTYTVTASYKNLHATAKCKMPAPVPIDTIILETIPGNDTLRSARLSLTVPEDVPAYFCISVSEVEEDADNKGNLHRPLPALMGTAQSFTPGEKLEIALFNAKNYENRLHFVPQMIVGHRLVVSLHRVVKEVYDYWTAYDNFVMFGHSIFLKPSSPPEGNIMQGLGIWSAQGTSTKNLEIK